MTAFIHENFLLQTESAKQLYHESAKDLPIIDYHCHLPPREIAENRQFENLTQIWLAGDHYKWRAMRAAGVDEKYITGDASDWDKFQAWAETVPKTLRNPLYHWTHLELKRPFGITKLLSPSTAKEIWDECNAKLQTPEFTARGIMRQMNVELVCTTDDPADDLQWHKAVAADKSFDIKVLPTFRPDKAMPDGSSGISDDYKNYIARLGKSADVVIKTPDDLFEALKLRHDYFHENGCRLSDHGFNQFQFYFTQMPEEQAATLTELLTTDDGCSYGDIPSLILQYIAGLDFQRNWTMQLHIGALRNNNFRMYEKLGADTGFDSMMDQTGLGNYLGMFFNYLDNSGKLPQTIVYNLNPVYNELITTMLGNFQGRNGTAEAAAKPPKMQFGSGWWFLDQKDGMEKQLNCSSNLGLLSGFVGMLTDSRSFLSYTRHEYFRRILCNMLGNDIENGLIPDNKELVGKMVKDISYYNAKNYFGFDS